MRFKRKKKGSALVISMCIATVFTIISGFVVSSVINTTKSNDAEVEYEDLLYIAESGIEDAVVKAGKGDPNFTSLNRPGEGTNLSYQYDILNFDSNNDIKLKVKRDGDLYQPDKPYNVSVPSTDPNYNPYVTNYFNIESTSKDKNDNEERTVKARIQPSLSNADLFKYALCGQVTKVSSGGAIHSATGPINATADDPSVHASGALSAGTYDNAMFNIPKYNFNEVNYTDMANSTLLIESSPGNSIMDQISSMSTSVTNSTSPSSISNGIANFNQTGNKIAGTNIKVYLINAKNLVLDFKNGESINNTMIICNGNITIKSSGSVTLSYGSIIGKSISLESGANLDIQFAPYEEALFPAAHCPLNKDDVKEINKMISCFAHDWAVDEGMGTSNDYWTSIKYEY